MTNPFWFYVLYSEKVDRFYMGITSNLPWRIEQHNRGLSPYTRKKGPWILEYSEEFDSRAKAQAREKEVKSWKSRVLLIERLKLNRQSGPGGFLKRPG